MGAEATEEQVWAYLDNYVEDARADKYPELAGLIRNALAYNRDFIAPTLLRRKPEGVEVAALERLDRERSEEHTSELQSLMRISYAVFCLKKKKRTSHHQ